MLTDYWGHFTACVCPVSYAALLRLPQCVPVISREHNKKYRTENEVFPFASSFELRPQHPNPNTPFFFFLILAALGPYLQRAGLAAPREVVLVPHKGSTRVPPGKSPAPAHHRHS